MTVVVVLVVQIISRFPSMMVSSLAVDFIPSFSNYQLAPLTDPS